MSVLRHLSTGVRIAWTQSQRCLVAVFLGRRDH